MSNIVLFIHVVLCLGLIVAILLQRSEGGALGIGGGSGSLLSGRGAANVLTRTTAILGGLFFLTSLALTLLSGAHSGSNSVTDDLIRGQNGAARITAPVLDGGAAAPAPGAPPAIPAPSAPTGPASGTPAEPGTGAPAVPGPAVPGQAVPGQAVSGSPASGQPATGQLPSGPPAAGAPPQSPPASSQPQR